MRSLNFSQNALDYPKSERTRLISLIQMCSQPGTCAGLPPIDCSAFGPHFRVRFDGMGCVKCDANQMLTLAFLAAAMVRIPTSSPLMPSRLRLCGAHHYQNPLMGLPEGQ